MNEENESFNGLALGLFMFCITNISQAETINWANDWEIQQTDSLATASIMQNGFVINVI